MKILKLLTIVVIIIFITNCPGAIKKENNPKGFLYKYMKKFELTPIAGKTGDIKLISVIPDDYKGRQKILKTIYSIAPVRVFKDNNVSYAEFNIKNINKKTVLLIDCVIEIYVYDLDTALRSKINYKPETKKSLAKYLVDEKYIECNDGAIIEASEQIKGGTRLEQVKQIFDFVVSHLKYRRQKEELGALYALKNGTGDCTEYDALFVALCRAKGIPARSVLGYSVTAYNYSHIWPEVYFDDLGWVPFDAAIDPLVSKYGQQATFSTLQKAYIYLSFNQYDKILNDHSIDTAWWDQNKTKLNWEVAVIKLSF